MCACCIVCVFSACVCVVAFVYTGIWFCVYIYDRYAHTIVGLNLCLRVLVMCIYWFVSHVQSIASMQQKLDDLHLLVQSGGVCVMVEGCGGCGKSALLKTYARTRGYPIGDNLVVVHLGEQIDGKVHGVVCYIVVKGLIKVKVLRLWELCGKSVI